MSQTGQCCRTLFPSLVILTMLGIGSAHAQGRPPTQPMSKMDEILARLERIEAKLDAPSSSATFCISQGRGLELAGKWAGELKLELEVGAGWPNVLWGKGTVKPALPLAFAPVPIPLPTELAFGMAGNHGRGFDICVELPLTLAAEDQTRLQDIFAAMNDPNNLGGTFGTKGKFQRRASRIIAFADRRVRGPFQSLESSSAVSRQAAAAADPELELDQADTAAENLLDGGLGGVDEGLEVFKDVNVRELLTSLEVPLDVHSIMMDPERIFEALPDVSGELVRVNCDQLQITPGMRNRRPLLDNLCSQLDDLPTFRVVKGAFDKIDGLSDEVVDAIAEIVAPLLSNVGEARETTKSRFCSSIIGQRRVFDQYCGR